MPELDSYRKWLDVRSGTAELRVDHVWRAEVADGPGTLACSPDGTRVATIGPAGVCSLWDRRTGTRVREITADLKLERVAFHPDGRQLFLGADHNGAVLLADGETGSITAPWFVASGILGPEGSPSFVREIQVGASGKILAIEVGFTDFAAESWRTERVLVALDVEGRRRLWHRREQESGPWSDFRVSRDEQVIQVVQAPDLVSYDARTGEERARWRGLISGRSGKCGPDEQFVFTELAQPHAGQPHYGLACVDLDQRVARTLNPCMAPVHLAAISPCGRVALAVTGGHGHQPPNGCQVVSLADGAVLVDLHVRHKDRWFAQHQFVAGGEVLLLATNDGLILHGSLVPRTMIEPAVARSAQPTGQEPALGSRPKARGS